MQALSNPPAPSRLHGAENWHAGAAPVAFESFVLDLQSALSPLPAPDRGAAGRRVREVIGRHIAKADLLDGMRYVLCRSSYSRVLLHADPDGHYSVLGLIWPPGCATPVHAHHTWCALGVLGGTLQEETFAAWDGESGAAGHPVSARSLRPGDSLCDPSEGRFVHRLANRSDGFAVSLHIYGVAAERIADGVNRVLASG